MTKIVRILFRVNTIYMVNSYHIYLTSCQNNISFESLHIICNQITCRTEYLTMIESLHFVQSHFLVTYTFQDSFQQRIFFIPCRHLQMLVPRNQHERSCFLTSLIYRSILINHRNTVRQTAFLANSEMCHCLTTHRKISSYTIGICSVCCHVLFIHCQNQ